MVELHLLVIAAYLGATNPIRIRVPLEPITFSSMESCRRAVPGALTLMFRAMEETGRSTSSTLLSGHTAWKCVPQTSQART